MDSFGSNLWAIFQVAGLVLLVAIAVLVVAVTIEAVKAAWLTRRRDERDDDDRRML